MFNRIDRIANIYTTSDQHLKVQYIAIYVKFDKKIKDFLFLQSYFSNENGYGNLLSYHSFYKKRSNM